MIRLVLLAGLAAMGAIFFVDLGGASGQASVSGGNWSFIAGSSANLVEIKVSGLPPEGLGAADVTIVFDSSVLEVTECTTGVMVGGCNPNAPAGPIRAAGFAFSSPPDRTVIRQL